MTGSEQVLIEDWCQQYPSHSVGSLAFRRTARSTSPAATARASTSHGLGPGRAVLGNPCGDPARSPGTPLSPPTAQGGALGARTSGRAATRSRSTAPSSASTRDGPGQAGQPALDEPRPERAPHHRKRLAQPVPHHRSPRDVRGLGGRRGWNDWEEINRLGPVTDPTVDNLGGPATRRRPAGQLRRRQPDHLREPLLGRANAVVSPHFTYDHADKVVPGETCPAGSSSVSGLAFYNGGNYPRTTARSLFADYSRNCIWVMRKGTNGLPFEPGLDVRRGRIRAGGHPDRPGRRPLLRAFDEGRSGGSASSARTSLRPRSRSPRRRAARRPSP